ncbi:helix-turn-helix transcriptional regulator [Desulfovibrio sp. ZJ200]|uniref:helix-turn-helix domain-containing protein n=1 Tax=Desulfovibrio sp. ZJ200 TaxID=2709792 RepID=UPI0013ECCADE|nr:helix-turn-helix transcriptional regulator [Desulfovibrio sp. ZJ200]
MEDYPQLTEAISCVITRLREDAGLSKRRLSMISHLDRVYLLQVEQGKYRPTLNFIFWLAQALGMSAGELVTLIEQEQKRLFKNARG